MKQKKKIIVRTFLLHKSSQRKACRAIRTLDPDHFSHFKVSSRFTYYCSTAQLNMWCTALCGSRGARIKCDRLSQVMSLLSGSLTDVDPKGENLSLAHSSFPLVDHSCYLHNTPEPSGVRLK